MELTKEQVKTLEKSIKTYGAEKTLLVCIEELSELIQAVTKMERYPDEKERYENIIEEIADVVVSIQYLKKIYCITDNQINIQIDKKITRQKIRMEGLM